MNSKSIWGKRLLSLVSAAYCAMVCWFSYLALFYEVSIPNKAAFCGVFSAVSLAALIAMLYSRFQILTRLSSIVTLPAALPFILICFGKWEVILPIAVTALVIFFCPVPERPPKPFSVSSISCSMCWARWGTLW
ncbi:MAG: hypothetical protein ACLUSL_02830 [Ruminococcus sp.]